MFFVAKNSRPTESTQWASWKIKGPCWFSFFLGGFVGDEILPSYVGIMINYLKDPYRTTRIQWNVSEFFFSGAQMEELTWFARGAGWPWCWWSSTNHARPAGKFMDPFAWILWRFCHWKSWVSWENITSIPKSDPFLERVPSLKLTASSHLKMDAWFRWSGFLLGQTAYFQRLVLLVSGEDSWILNIRVPFVSWYLFVQLRWVLT